MLLQHPSPSPSPKTLTNPFTSPSIFPKNLIPHFRRTSFLIRASAAPDANTLPKSAIQRIADKLRSLGYVPEEEKQGNISNQNTVNGTLTLSNSPGEIFVPLPNRIPKHRVGHTLDQSWSTPENPVPEPGSGTAIRRYNEIRREVWKEKVKRRDEGTKERESVPTMAELKVSRDELRRLRGVGIGIKKVLKIGKAGITEGIVNGIHERWRNTELVKIVCEDMCRLNMKRSHDLLERKTGGLVVWRSGGIIILYRGADYKYPYFFANNVKPNDASVGESMSLSMDSEEGVAQESYTASTDNIASGEHMKTTQPPLIQGVGSRTRVRFQLPGEAQLAEEADLLLHGLGPRFIDWYGYDPLPVDADLLPAIIPGYRKPFRLLPFGVQPKLTNDEMTTLRRLGRPLPCHFALGRNRKHQGLAAAILKLWEKCEIAKIAVKKGVQNTNSELMAEELKWLTGGTLLTRDKEYIVLYRGKDFLPATVSSAIEQRRNRGVDGLERKKITSSSDVQENKVKEMGSPVTELSGIRDQKLEIAIEQRKQRSREAAIKKTSSKLSQALESKEKAEKLLEELEKGEIKQPLDVDKEGITEEERYMLRKVGMKMRPFLLLGRRGVFDGTVENMHLHWKYRELVKILCGETSIDEVHAVARTLEAESGGILVAVERVRKGHAIIVYRGKNYKRPPTLRPQTLLNKREALKRYVETQRRESLKLHVLKLGKNVEDLKVKLAKSEEANIQGDKDQNIQLEQEMTISEAENMEPDSDLEVQKSNSSHVDYGKERELHGDALVFSNEIDTLQDPVTTCEDRLRESSMEFKEKDCVDFSDSKVDMNPQRDGDECEFTETNSKASIISMKETCETETAKTHKASTSPIEFKATTSYAAVGFSVSSPPTNLRFRRLIIANGHRLPCFRQFVKVSANLQGGGGYKGGAFFNSPKTRELIADWVSKNDDSVRRLPIYVGGISLLGVLFNRTLFGIAPVADASSSQSRADLLTIGLAVTNILAGLVWLSIRPKTISVVPPRGVECERMHSSIPSLVAYELTWAWESLSTVTCSRSLVIVYDGICILQIGYASVSSSIDGEPVMVDSDKLMQGSIYQSVVKSGTQSYLANLSLYPGKSELPFLPSNTQAVILQPLGDRGIAILGGDTIRGFTTSDQAWITLIGEKLDATLSKHMTRVPLASSKAR